MQGGIKVRRLRRKRKPGNVKWLIKILTVTLVLLSVYFFIHSSFFAVTSIKVVGAEMVDASDIVTLSGLTEGENIFKIDQAEAKIKIAANSMIAGVEIKKRFPRTVQIMIKERIPVALLPVEGGLIQIDIEGFVLKKKNELSSGSLPIITGLKIPDTLAVGKKPDTENLEMGLKMIAQMDEGAKKQIAEINVFDPQKLRAYTVDGAEIRLGNGDGFQEKFSKFLQVLKEEEKQNRLKEIQYIDVSFSGKPVVFYRK